MNIKNSFIILLFMALQGIVNGQQGLVGEYFNGTNFEEKKMTRTDAAIDFYWDNSAPAPGIKSDAFSVRWKGRLKAPKTGNYLFRAQVDDGIRVKINGKLVINGWSLNDHLKMSGNITLQEGQLYDLEVEYFNGLLEGEIKLFWQLPGEEPTFGGLFGYNDKLIDGSYFYQPVKVPEAPKPTMPKAKPEPPKTTLPPATPPKKPAKTAKPKPQPVKPKPSPIAKDTLEKYIPKNVLFEQSKSVLLLESYPALDQFAGYLLRNPSLKVSIEGHTDNHGDSAKNLVLSDERAKKVASYLVNKGVVATRLSTKGYGDTRPLNKEKSNTSYTRNRRVEFIVTEK